MFHFIRSLARRLFNHNKLHEKPSIEFKLIMMWHKGQSYNVGKWSIRSRSPILSPPLSVANGEGTTNTTSFD